MATNTDSLVNKNSLVPKINAIMATHDLRRYVITSFACAVQLNEQVQAKLVDLFPVRLTGFPPFLIV